MYIREGITDAGNLDRKRDPAHSVRSEAMQSRLRLIEPERNESEPAIEKPEGKKRNAVIEVYAAKAVQGGKDALNSLCEALAKGVLYRAKYMLGNEMDAEDVSLEILIRLCENIRKLHDTKAFMAWFSRIIINETRRFMAERVEEQNIVSIDEYLELVADDKNAYGPEESYMNKNIRQEVMEIISKLPARQREVLMLYYFDELDIAEIAWTMDIQHQCVTKYLEIACSKLKNELEKAPYAAGAGVMAIIGNMDMGALISDSFNSEAASFEPANALWLTIVFATCQEYIMAHSAKLVNTAPKAVKSKVKSVKLSFKAAMVTLTTVVTVGAVSLGLLLGGTAAPDRDDPAMQASASDGRIVFSGGEDYRGSERVNPKGAELQAESGYSDLTVLEWWITTAESETVLHQGRHGEMHHALSQLRENGEHGEYNLFIRYIDKSGDVYRIHSNFFIHDV